jgi:hypothetical protein
MDMRRGPIGPLRMSIPSPDQGEVISPDIGIDERCGGLVLLRPGWAAAGGLPQAVAVAIHGQDADVGGSRSSRAPVRRSDPRMEVQSSNGRLEVTMVEPRSYRCEKVSNRSSAPVDDSGT